MIGPVLLKNHCVFSTKQRVPVLNPDVQESLTELWRVQGRYLAGSVEQQLEYHRTRTFQEEYLAHRLAYNDDIVAFKMGRRQGGPSRQGARRAHV
jgi:hypothetical protein